MKKNKKLKYFEYLVKKLIEWYKDVCNNKDISYAAFTRLKLQKLLFLASAINACENNSGLLSIFDDFYAMQYGPVESDIYNAMMNDKFDKLSFSERYMIIQEDITNISQGLDENIIKKIDDAIYQLRLQNDQLIKYPAFKLVDITHKWKSWQNAIDIATALGNGSEKMPINDIRLDAKYFS